MKMTSQEFEKLNSKSTRATSTVLYEGKKAGWKKTDNNKMQKEEHIKNMMLHEMGVIEYKYKLGADTQKFMDGIPESELLAKVKDIGKRVRDGKYDIKPIKLNKFAVGRRLALHAVRHHPAGSSKGGQFMPASEFGKSRTDSKGKDVEGGEFTKNPLPPVEGKDIREAMSTWWQNGCD